jgi:hypothetical protein
MQSNTGLLRWVALGSASGDWRLKKKIARLEERTAELMAASPL